MLSVRNGASHARDLRPLPAGGALRRSAALAAVGGQWHEQAMSNPPASRAAGFFIALSVLVGAIAGVALGQPSLGTLIGAAVGIVVSLLLWLRDRRPG
jgi:hypothetical protein